MLGFIPSETLPIKPICFLCGEILSNESMNLLNLSDTNTQNMLRLFLTIVLSFWEKRSYNF